MPITKRGRECEKTGRKNARDVVEGVTSKLQHAGVKQH